MAHTADLFLLLLQKSSFAYNHRKCLHTKNVYMDQTGNLQTNLNNLPKVYFVSLINFFFKKSFMFSLFHKKTRQYTEGSADKLHKKI